MDSFEFNKIAGAILGTLLLVMGVGFIAEIVYKPIEGRGDNYVLPEPESDGRGGDEVEVVEIVPLPVLLAAASADDGARVARKCQSCHTFDEGGDNKTGPGLFDIVGRVIGEHNGFSYSADLADMGTNGDVWTYASLDAFIAAPKAFASGTKMTFAGLKNETERADLLAYMQSLSNSPVAFPAVAVAEATEEAMPATDEEEAAMAEPMMAEEEVTTEEPVAEEAANSDEPAAAAEPAMTEESANTEDASMDAPAEDIMPEGTINSAAGADTMMLPDEAPMVDAPAAQ